MEDTEEKEAVRVTMAGCLNYLGRRDEARQQLESVLCVNPANQGAREMIESMAA